MKNYPLSSLTLDSHLNVACHILSKIDNKLALRCAENALGSYSFVLCYRLSVQFSPVG